LRSGLDLVFETLMVSSEDEISANYGLLAEAVRYPDDYSWVSYRLREGARWHDGEPVTAGGRCLEFRADGREQPAARILLPACGQGGITGPREVTFTFDEKNNKELPKIVGELIILPKHWWEERDGESRHRRNHPAAGSGLGPLPDRQCPAWRKHDLRAGEDYWGADLNVNVGQNNFDRITYTYFADRNVEFEAFKSGNVDFWQENEAKRWVNAYDFPAVEEGRITRENPKMLYRSSGVLVGFIPICAATSSRTRGCARR
jgi:microcin C transport system substrate-binding protein